jgi:hypothetical protein
MKVLRLSRHLNVNLQGSIKLGVSHTSVSLINSRTISPSSFSTIKHFFRIEREITNQKLVGHSSSVEWTVQDIYKCLLGKDELNAARKTDVSRQTSLRVNLGEFSSTLEQKMYFQSILLTLAIYYLSIVISAPVDQSSVPGVVELAGIYPSL